MTKPLVTPNIANMVPYQPGKPVEELERELGIRNAVKLASNENPLGVSPRGLAAAEMALKHSNRYPDGGAFVARDAIANKLGLSRDEIFLGNGSVDLIELLVRTFVGPEDEGLTSQGSFSMYTCAFQTLGRPIVEVPTRNFHYDLEAIAAAITPATKLIFLANPDNPTGTYFNRESFERFLTHVPQDVIVVLDEAYCEFVRAKDYPDGLTYRDRVPRLVVLRTLAKAYGLGGLRVGYGISTPEIAGYIHRTRLPFNVNIVAQAAAAAAIYDDEFLHQSQKHCAESMEFLEEGLRRLNVWFLPSQTNFIFLDVERDGTEVYQELLREGVIVRPMKGYGYHHHLRVSIGLPEENQRFLTALAKVMKRV